MEISGNCRICGQSKRGEPFESWVRDTFTNLDRLQPGEIICDTCKFWFEQKSEHLQRRMGKDKPQKMQNYSHFIINGEWIPVGKGDKRRIAALLLDGKMPEMAAIAISGQKHIAFRARRNPPGQDAGWVQFEERAVWVEQKKLKQILEVIERLYTVFSKYEIESGQYAVHRILQYGMERWREDEASLQTIRRTNLFELALFLAQRSEENGDDPRIDRDDAENSLEGNTGGLQEPLPHDHLGSIPIRDSIGGLHRQPGAFHQLNLFTDGH